MSVLELQKLCVKSNDRDLRDVNMNIEMENVKIITQVLKTLAIMAIRKHKLSTEGLPRTLLEEIYFMTASNVISKPLRTVENLSTD